MLTVAVELRHNFLRIHFALNASFDGQHVVDFHRRVVLLVESSFDVVAGVV